MSEFMRGAPSSAVVTWRAQHRGEGVATTAVTVAELRYGIERLPVGRRRAELDAAARRTLGSFAGQVMPFDEAAAEQYGVVVAGRDRRGKPIGPLDAQIAAICWARRARLATRNTVDFTDTGVELIDPWA